MFHKSLYTFKNKIELQTNPFYFYKYPNFGVKVNWWNKKNGINLKFFNKNRLLLSSVHEITYPTMALNFAKTRAFVNYSPTPNDITSFLRFKNEIIVSVIFKKNKSCFIKYSIYTLKVGNIMTLKNKNHNYIIDYNSFFFRNTSMFYDKSLWYIGLQYDNDIKNNIYYKISLNYYTVGLNFNNSIIEHKTLAYTYLCRKNKCRLGLGYSINFATGNYKPSIMPMFAIGYLFKVKSNKKNKNLFKSGILNTPEENRNMF
ncbi:MAG: hypothetical protein U9Q83_11350 [Bacteroidota bacterium]|nr:hypothetical protein [Bacteroidota bacterium]